MHDVPRSSGDTQQLAGLCCAPHLCSPRRSCHPHPACPSTATAAAAAPLLTAPAGDHPLLPHTPSMALARSCQGVLAESSPLRAGQEVAGKLPGSGSCPAQLVPRATGRLQILAMAQEGKVPQDHAESRGTSLLLPPDGSLPRDSDMRP